jgi:16S rRNA (adenine1518-N6/adenine1519-N6)-dimethyltransferase
MPRQKDVKPRGRPLGQHFLFDRNVLGRIADAAELRADDCVLEVGPGLGTLTEHLAARAKRVVAVELDASLGERFLSRMAGYGNVELVHADILKVDLDELWQSRFGGAPFKVVANLPYYITTPIIMRFIESGLPVVSLTVMVQKEVADRLASPPGSREYGAISVAVQYRSAVTRLFAVPAGAFSPPPRVESAVLRLDMLEKPAVAVCDEAMFRKTVRGCFSQRRKTLRNNVSAVFGVSGDEAAASIRAAGLDPGGRAERLGLIEFAALADRLSAEGYRAE